MPAALGLVLLAVVCAIVAVLYYMGVINLFSSHTGRHTLHTILFGGLALVSLIAANFVRPKAVA